MAHVTVLQREAVDALQIRPDSIIVDCTLGSGGHAREIISLLGTDGTFVGIDADPAAIMHNHSLTAGQPSVHLVNNNFRDIANILDELAIDSVDGILADLGWRMEQFDSSEGLPRGFSFAADEPLTMTFGAPEQYAFTAADIINEWDEEDIANVLFGYGEERAARRLAHAIVEARQTAPIVTARQLAELIVAAHPVPRFKHKTHPATKTFQALRIAVNDEFDTLRTLIMDGFLRLKPGGRLVIITFHSLEDRIVKHTFRELVHDQAGVLVNKKPLTPSDEELINNSRARSAKLRTLERSN